MLRAKIAASSTVIAFEFMKLMNLSVYPKAHQTPNWRGIAFAVILVFVFNSMTGALIKAYMEPTGDVLGIIGGYLIGDTVGSIFGMLSLLITFGSFYKQGKAEQVDKPLTLMPIYNGKCSYYRTFVVSQLA